MKKFLAALLLGAALPAAATTITRDYSDLWFIPSEAGWGANMAQQGDIIFLTLFVYGPNTQPTWYVASDMTFQGGATPRFTGPLYQTSGPFFGTTPFNPNAVTLTQVGIATFTPTSATTGTLAYNVGNTNVTKNVQRQTFRTESIAGVYQGATIGTYSNCQAGNGPYDSTASFTITQAAQSIVMTEFGNGYQCNYTGIYTQAGRMGTITGTGSCTPGGTPQTFVGSEVQVTPQGLTMVMTADAGPCHFVGRVGGLRRQ